MNQRVIEMDFSPITIPAVKATISVLTESKRSFRAAKIPCSTRKKVYVFLRKSFNVPSTAPINVHEATGWPNSHRINLDEN